jgi:galactose mutarotase-like enzyme
MPQLTTDALSLHVDGRRGGKITSLLDRRSGREWLLRPKAPSGRPAGYGATFVDTELSGWDEMVPTIDACRLDGPVEQVLLPDHGEVWSVVWDTVAVDDRYITMRVEGRALPYQLERTIEVVERDRLRFSYRLRNHGDHAFPVLWAAHPQFVWTPGARVELPPQVEQVLDLTGGPDPVVVAWDDTLATRLDRLGDGEGHKVWTLPGQGPAWSRLRDPDGGALTIQVDPTVAPYLGIWWDSGMHSPVRVVALEPSTGYYDDLAFAAAAERVPWASPGDELRWDLEVELDAAARA